LTLLALIKWPRFGLRNISRKGGFIADGAPADVERPLSLVAGIGKHVAATANAGLVEQKKDLSLFRGAPLPKHETVAPAPHRTNENNPRAWGSYHPRTQCLNAHRHEKALVASRKIYLRPSHSIALAKDQRLIAS
jgi:hypothetical protein